MARLDYADSDSSQGPDREIVERIRARRGGTLHALDRMLLHSPPVADGWNHMLGAVRTATTISDDVRELAILRIAAVNGADFEWHSHEPLGRAGGLTDADLAVLRGKPGVLAPRLAATLAYTDAMTTQVQVPDDVFNALGKYFDDRQIVELTLTIGSYNLVSRFLVALEIGTDAEGATG